MSVRIFLSYARIDDELPSNVVDGKGFVTCLYQELFHQLRQSGDDETKIWRDTRDIDPADQFDQVIKNAIGAADLFLVVLSPNWMKRPYCRKELDYFCERRKHIGIEKIKHRIIVACKRFVAFGNRPSLLQGQTGHEFFAFEGPDYSGTQFEYFQRGQPQDRRYFTAVGGLAASVSLRADQLRRNKEVEPLQIDEQEHVRQDNGGAARPAIDPNGRKIYLAKPASDMQIAYSRLVEELTHNGYAILPDPKQSIPFNSSASAFVDLALAEAELSIHLLGDEPGYAPEKCDPIVKLQLERAQARGLAGNGPSAGFRRIIWAPETLDNETSDDGTAGTAAAATRIRKPHQVLSRFGKFQTTDKVLGGTISKFVDFLEEHLLQTARARVDGGGPEPTADDWVYVYHVPADTEYACNLMDAFKQRGIAASMPALEGAPEDLARVHRQRLADCSAVVLCWAQATEAWAHARADELKDLKALGRQKKFLYRGLLAGPPPGVRKTMFEKYPPPNTIDVVVNLNEERRPLVEAIDKFTRMTPAHAS